MDEAPNLTVEEARGHLGAAQGPRRADANGGLWRSFEELAETPGFEDMLHREFPRQASEWDNSVDRRQFLTLAGASLGLAGLTACSKQPEEKIVPYVRQPEELVPGKPLLYATSMPQQGYAAAVLAESHMGRPTKLEGNPEHPASLGGTDLFAQAATRDLYDPDRSQTLTHLGKIKTWGAFVEEMGPRLQALDALGGDGLRILTGTVTSPTLGRLLNEVLAAMPQARWHQFESAGRDNLRAGAKAAYGEPVEVRYDLSKADVVVSIDGDFLNEGPGAVRYSKDFAGRRRVADPAQAEQMSRLYCVESTPSSLSSVADHRLSLKPTQLAQFVLALASQLGVAGATNPGGFDGEVEKAWLEELAKDLQAHAGASALIPGESLDAAAQTLVHAINEHLGNVGNAVLVSDPVEVDPVDQAASFAELMADMEAGKVDTLVLLGVNPVYGSAADQDVAAALQNVKLRIHLGQYDDETAEHCQWHIPEAHFLEDWGDLRAFDGTASVVQPLIEPLYGGKTAAEVVAVLLGLSGLTAEDLVKETWKAEAGAEGSEGNFEKFWRRALHDGLVAETEFPSRAVALDGGAVAAAASEIGSRTAGDLELMFRPDSTVWDGRYGNNAWLQECPKVISKLTWDNALLMSPQTARDLGLGNLVKGNDQRGEAPLVDLTVGEHTLSVPAWVVPGQSDGTLVLHLGYGRWRGGQIMDGVGFDANQVRPSASPWLVTSGVQVAPGSGSYLLATTQDHHSLEGRHLVRMANRDAYVHDPEHAGAQHHHTNNSLSLMTGDDFPYDGYAWGMSIDLTTCTGCNTCLVACQAENNIPSVGKDQVSKGREMHWIRVDRYYKGDADHAGEIVNQPVPCMQCEQAPCEVVCPVAATVHSDEGLNDMVYNRCVGTRYCSNNCPYKVRRFNFLLYQDFETPSLQLGRNPDVSVRSRGVMEKCTYCVQRINQARIEAKKESRKIADGEIVTACQGACPSDAIVFGDINDPDSKISQAKASPLDYSLLEELGTRPRTTYLGRIRNPNPGLLARLEPADAAAHDASHGAPH